MPDLPKLELICLGPPTVRVDGADPAPDVVWRRHLGLLIYLAMSPDGGRSREQVMGMLWPEKPRDKARHSLNEAVRRLRVSLGAERMLTEGERITLSRDNLVVDVHRLEALQPTNAVELVDLLRGEFLEGFFIDDAHAFDEWATIERARVRDLGAQACITFGERSLSQGDISSARALAGAALRMHPHAEAAASLGMRSAALDQDSAAALSIYHGFAKKLKDEIGEEPSLGLAELAEQGRADGSGREDRLADGQSDALDNLPAFDGSDRDGKRCQADVVIVNGLNGDLDGEARFNHFVFESE